MGGDAHPDGDITIVYVSRAAEPMDAAALESLLEASRARNRRERVTGMMLYAYGGFVQQLEGEAEAVDRVFASIARDPRHQDVRVLSRRPISRRRYGDLAMGAKHPYSDPTPAASSADAPAGDCPLADSELVNNQELAENLLAFLAPN
jgi:hypothetical protein